MGEVQFLQADFPFWLWVIIGIIYFISRFTKKQKADLPENSGEEAKPSENRPKTGERQLTFEELLREISEGKQAQTVPKPEPVKKVVVPVDYDDDLVEEEQELEDVKYDYRKKDNIYDVYEKAKSEAFERPSLEDVDWKKQKTEMAFEKFRGFEEESRQNLMELYLSDLKSPEGLKKAFVVSEILKPKF